MIPHKNAANCKIGLYPAAGWTQDYARKALRTEMRLDKALEGACYGQRDYDGTKRVHIQNNVGPLHFIGTFYFEALKLKIGRIMVSMVTVSPILAIISEAGLYTIGDSSRVKSLTDSEYMPVIDASKSAIVIFS